MRGAAEVFAKRVAMQTPLSLAARQESEFLGSRHLGVYPLANSIETFAPAGGRRREGRTMSRSRSFGFALDELDLQTSKKCLTTRPTQTPMASGVRSVAAVGATTRTATDISMMKHGWLAPSAKVSVDCDLPERCADRLP